ncbi:response regulator transcription factor [uncultured Tenacibaculum sp.]|uniref:LytR/AlgR family response regulator transcription factor n=1 Tax=uncultured Tenacibaculum sp. TaxID=174713 RepID=UPI0026158F55|nr:response regulator transcription factor [uncultured Tenacibaculum sp.]
MKVLIIEDEITAAEHLEYLLTKIDSEIEIQTVLDSVKSSIAYLSKSNVIELIFMDIHLSDGLSFEIFDHINIQTPIIFTTAYDQYAIKAFKVNSIDYILKPITENELLIAITKFKTTRETTNSIHFKVENVLELLKKESKTYKSTYLVQKREILIPLKIQEIAYFYIEMGIVKSVSLENNSFIIQEKLEEIEEEVDPALFYRANRQIIINKNIIKHVKHFFNGKLLVETVPKFEEKIIISKAKAKDFKTWLDS